ncbi:MAG: FadR family transcriptional regulator [Betaproteobacteria bacterium]|nr:FadR family transcriptional regulator [Betaproteobacteria bacterium]
MAAGLECRYRTAGTQNRRATSRRLHRLPDAGPPPIPAREHRCAAAGRRVAAPLPADRRADRRADRPGGVPRRLPHPAGTRTRGAARRLPHVRPRSHPGARDRGPGRGSRRHRHLRDRHRRAGGPGRRPGPLRPAGRARTRRRRGGRARCAPRADAETVGRLQATIATMRRSDDDFATRDAADREFHTLIAEASGNGALPLLVGTLWDQRRGSLWTRLEGHFHTPALRASTLDDHAAIVAALERHDPAAARAAMIAHLQRVVREFQQRWDELDDGFSPSAVPLAAPAAKKRKQSQSQSPSARRSAAGRSH